MFPLLLALQITGTPLAEPFELTSADKKAIAAVVAEELKDPESARYEWYPAFDEYIYCGTVNAKNSFGGYTGPKLFAILYAKGPKGLFVVPGSAEVDNMIAIQMCEAAVPR